MSAVKRLFIINFILFIIIGGGFALFSSMNLIVVRDFAETSFVENNEFITAVNEAKEEIESSGGLTSEMYDDFAATLKDKDYYTIVVKNNREVFFNIDSESRTRNFTKAFDRSKELEEIGAVIYKDKMIYVLFDPLDETITYHIINTNYSHFVNYEKLQNYFLIALVSYTFVGIVIMGIVEAKKSNKPLRQLREASRRMMANDYEYPVKTYYTDEVGKLYKDFDTLRKSLRQAKDERESMAKDKEEYIAGITHDLKTPLTSIIGFSKGLLDGVPKSKEQTKKYLKTIYDTSLHMNSLIEKLKEYSRLDLEKLEFNLEKVNIVELINDFVSKNAVAYHANEVTITTKLGIPLVSEKTSTNDYMAMVDVEEFNRVLTNIINNTVKYKRKGMAYVEIIVSRGNKQIVITIKDDGPGVKEKDLETIFDCFYRGDSSRTRPTEGSGLGLYVVHTIISAHKGTVKAVNDNGLKIIITIPEVDDEKKNTNYRR